MFTRETSLMTPDVFYYCLLPKIDTGDTIRSLSQVCKQWRRLVRRYLQADLTRVNIYKLGLIEDVYHYPYVWSDLEKRMRDFLNSRFKYEDGIPYGGVLKKIYPSNFHLGPGGFQWNTYAILDLDIRVIPPLFTIYIRGFVWYREIRDDTWVITCKVRFDGGIPRLEWDSNGIQLAIDLQPCMKEFFRVFTRCRNVVFRRMKGGRWKSGFIYHLRP